MAGALLPIPRYRAVDSDGAPIAGAKLTTYAAGTSTPQATYSDSALTTPNANPVVADAGGLFGPIYFSAVSYKLVLTTSADVTVYSQDNVYDFAQIGTLGNITTGTITADGLIRANAGLAVDTISEDTPASGVTIDGVLLKDGGATLTAALTGTTATLSGLITADGGQVKFPATQVPSTNVNTLDDYEEGTWTPVIGGASGTSGQTYSTQSGGYIKIGKMVFLYGDVTLSAKGTISGVARITGLPFTVGSVSQSASFGFFSGLATNVVNVVGHAGGGGAFIDLYMLTAAAAAPTAMTTTDIGNTTRFMFSLNFAATA